MSGRDPAGDVTFEAPCDALPSGVISGSTAADNGELPAVGAFGQRRINGIDAGNFPGGLLVCHSRTGGNKAQHDLIGPIITGAPAARRTARNREHRRQRRHRSV